MPWLQDDTERQVWSSWEVRYRDLVVLDRANERSGVLNFTANDLAEEENYAAARQLFLDAAASSEP